MVRTAPSLTFTDWSGAWFWHIPGDFSELGQRRKGAPSRVALSLRSPVSMGLGREGKVSNPALDPLPQ